MRRWREGGRDEWEKRENYERLRVTAQAVAAIHKLPAPNAVHELLVVRDDDQLKIGLHSWAETLRIFQSSTTGLLHT